MLIRDFFVVPNRGTVIILDANSPELIGVHIGTKLRQGDNVWEVTGVEMPRPSPTSTVGLLIKPASPFPEKGPVEIGDG